MRFAVTGVLITYSHSEQRCKVLPGKVQQRTVLKPLCSYSNLIIEGRNWKRWRWHKAPARPDPHLQEHVWLDKKKKTHKPTTAPGKANSLLWRLEAPKRTFGQLGGQPTKLHLLVTRRQWFWKKFLDKIRRLFSVNTLVLTVCSQLCLSKCLVAWRHDWQLRLWTCLNFYTGDNQLLYCTKAKCPSGSLCQSEYHCVCH